jgi:coenzyme A diphosphatase NUDT7
VLAAVLVVLYERPGGRGGLRVLLTTRSKELRSHPGQTALPGGKVDKTDAGVVETAVSISSKLDFPIYLIIAMRDGA